LAAGGCVGGALEFQFFKNGVVVQEFSAKTLFQDSPLIDASYSVKARCSTEHACTSLGGASLNVPVYRGDGDELALTVTPDRAAGATTLRWQSRPPPAPMSGYNVFRGAVPPPDTALGTLSALQCNVPQPAAVGSELTLTTTAAPAPGGAHYYLVGHRNQTAGSKTALGRTSSGAVRVAPVGCP
jgi:hypothetical protein